MENNKKFYRSKSDRIIAGVCGGLGEYLKIDSVFFRVAFVLAAFFGGSGILIYLILALVIPETNDSDNNESLKQTQPTKEFNNNLQANINNMVEEKIGQIKKGKLWGGVFLIFLGLLFLLDSFMPKIFSFDKLWPLILIVIGILVLAEKKNLKSE